MVRVKSFFTWLRGGTFLTSGPRNTLIAAHAAIKFAPGDGGSSFIEQPGVTETPEERSRRLKRERDRRYKAKKKADKGGFQLPADGALA